MASPKILVEENVPMRARDGTVLRANIFRPDITERLPVLVERTPYGKAAPQSGAERYAEAGYVLVSQDSRGRYASEGDWLPYTRFNTGDAEDGYDLVEWAAVQPWSNGKIGAMGASYPAWMAWMHASLAPPHLVAISARSIPMENTDVDWPGAFKPARRVNWWLTNMAPDVRRRDGLPPPHTPAQARQIWNDEHAHALSLFPWSKIIKFLPPGLAVHAEDFLRNPARKSWRFAEKHATVRVPNFDVTGWFDHCNGSIRHLPGMQKNAATPLARSQTKLVIGPWSHVGAGRALQGDVDFGPTANFDIFDAVIRWFDHWLKGADNGVPADPPVRYFIMGSGEWKSALTWPPERTSAKNLFLRSTGVGGGFATPGSLSAEPAAGDEPHDHFQYDPDNPVPTLWAPAHYTVPADRRKVEYRQDILFYFSPPLEADLTIAGDPEVILYASTSALDTDFFARLVDDDPAGRAIEISYGMLRARHRNTLDREEFITPNAVVEYRIKLGPTACCFRKGHRLRLEVTSSDYPNHDRNHNVGRDDLFDTELRIAEQRVFHTAAYPSRVVLPMIT